MIVSAFLVVFIAEWGDITRIVTSNLAAHYHDALSVAVGAVAALWAVAAMAVTAGTGLLRIGVGPRPTNPDRHRARGTRYLLGNKSVHVTDSRMAQSVTGDGDPAPIP
jgi:hypothetical protein